MITNGMDAVFKHNAHFRGKTPRAQICGKIQHRSVYLRCVLCNNKTRSRGSLHVNTQLFAIPLSVWAGDLMSAAR